MRKRVKKQQSATKYLHRHQESWSLFTWTTTQRRFKIKRETSISWQSTINNLVTPSTIPIATYTMSSTLVAIRKQSSSTKEKTMKKSKLTARHPTINFLRITSTTRENDAVTEQYLLLNQQSSQRAIPLIKNFIQDVFYTPKGKHSSFQCIILRKAIRAPPPFAD